MAFVASCVARNSRCPEEKEQVDQGCEGSRTRKDTQLQSPQRVVADEDLGQRFRPVFLDGVVLEAVKRPLASYRDCAIRSLGLRKGDTLLPIRALRNILVHPANTCTAWTPFCLPSTPPPGCCCSSASLHVEK